MAKPIIKKVNPFDASKAFYMEFIWTGIRAYANRLVVYDNSTNAVIFDDTIQSYALTHKIPANTLRNGQKYNAQIYVTDINSNVSASSDKVLFYTFETPVFEFKNIHDGETIKSSSLTADVKYFSSAGETISFYNYYLYDFTKKLLIESETFTDPSSISYTYRGLNNDTAFYIRCRAATVNGAQLDTGLVRIYIKFKNQNEYSRIYTEPLPNQGCIKISSNFIIIQYNGTDTFEYENGMINLIDKTLYYDNGFLIEDDFTAIIRGTNLYQTAEIFKMRNEDGSFITLSSRVYTDDTLRFKLTVPNGVSNYILYSEPLVFDDEDYVYIGIRKKKDIYQIYVKVTERSSSNDWWWGNDFLSTDEIELFDNWIDTNNPMVKYEKEDVETYYNEKEPDVATQGDIWLGR